MPISPPLFCFSIKELRKFTDETYPELKEAYSDLNKKKDAYDFARHKLKSCKPDHVEERGETAQKAQKEFEQHANTVFELLQKIPDHEMTLAKAFYTYTRAESDYTRAVNELVKGVPSPVKKGTESKSSAKSVPKK